MLFHRKKQNPKFDEDFEMNALRFLDASLRIGSFLGEVMEDVHKNIFDYYNGNDEEDDDDD